MVRNANKVSYWFGRKWSWVYKCGQLSSSVWLVFFKWYVLQKKKIMKVYAQSRQNHTIVEIGGDFVVFINWY